MIYLGVGSSIGNGKEIFDSAERFLNRHGVSVTKKSKIYKNPPMGGVAKNEFSNGVWEVSITPPLQLSPAQQAFWLLEICKKTEKNAGRDFSAQRWSDRTLDLDILMFHDLVLNTDKLTIPHPEIQNRDFVLTPWWEIVNRDFEVPGLGKLKSR